MAKTAQSKDFSWSKDREITEVYTESLRRDYNFIWRVNIRSDYNKFASLGKFFPIPCLTKKCHCGNMEPQDKRRKDTDNIGIESKEGERRRLSCNNVGNRSPSLDVDKYIFSEETVFALADLGHTLRRIYTRLRSEGHIIETGIAYKDYGDANREN